MNETVNKDATWYAVRIVPGAQKMARAIPNAPEHPIGETLLERECRNNGITIFMPSFWTVARHQRTNKLIEKRFPLLVGYAFVRIDDKGFGAVRELNTVSYFLRGGGHYGLASFPDETLVELYLAELEAKEQHSTTKRAGEAEVRKERRSILGRQLGSIFPKGRRKKVPIRMMAAAAMNSLTPEAKERCASILEELEKLDKDEAESRKSPANPLNSAA
ncbi:transcription termination/antitermination NusG family protein [Agrobacterium pusense]|uniref:transcription termination/antitermination NusG family protein n=1 Tax=Agrobacterium pusense TaxID=648995 RepID=UPI00384E8215